ncbi:ABC transporter ATP-binding protein [Corynebacterium ulceribovis]|uniref:ABC transporter ATP-binding protein n=1 Tax=Corynebacterium ulceribovis TaxID=487732 RepID=UPI00037DA9F1|nr:ABC transporter ATP-binding protein [Corynebacterium ulceribovis]
MRSSYTLWKLCGPARWAVAGGALLRLVQSLFLGMSYGAAISLVIALVQNQTIGAADFYRILVLCLASVATQLLCGWASARMSWLASYRTVAHMRLTVLDHLRQIPIGALGKRQRSEVSSLLSSDLQLVESFLSEGAPRLGQSLGIPLLVIGVVLTQDPLLALTLAAPILAIIPLMTWSSKRLAELADQRQQSQAQAAARMIDVVSAMPALRVFSTRARTESWYDQAVQDFRDLSVTMLHRLILPLFAASLVLLLGVPVVLLVGSMELIRGTAEVALVALVFVLVLNVYQPVLGLLSSNESWQMAQAALRRVNAVLAVPPLAQSASAENTADVPAAEVSFDAVDYRYPDGTQALRSMTFTAEAGKTTAIVGPSGAGKSTVLNLIARFDDPTAGVVRVGGADLRTLDAAHRADAVTMVFQDVHLFPGTVADNIAVGNPQASRSQIVAAAELAGAAEFIAQLPAGYDTVLGEDGAGLSGGQRQRLSIARAALKNAPVVLLDEATAALDPVNEAAVQRGLAALLENRTAIVIAHRLGTIAAADNIVVVDNGAVVESGQHADLLAKGGLYARLWSRLRAAGQWRLG